ncbi:MAG: transcriptional regulator [Lutibacter sp.]|nr:MAG: transcriptional regulator [Lutibacter sp.]
MAFSKDVLFIKKVGHQIKTFRKSQDMTQFDLAIKSGMEENALQRIEVGRTNPTIKTLLKITCALEIEMFELFMFSDEKK